MNVNELQILDIADIALGGKALGRQDGRVVFVDRGLPGDRVRARITRVRRSWAEARLESIEAPAPNRIAAPCPHAERCGGCRLQELPYPAQLALKEKQVRETLVRLGGFADPRVLPIVAAPETFRYRNKMEFSFAPDPDAAPGSDATPVLGLHERGTFDRVFPLETCLLPSALSVEIVRFTAAFAASHRWRAYDVRRHQGVARFLAVRHLPHTGQCAVLLIAASDDLAGVDEWARGIAALSPEVTTVVFGINHSRAGVAIAEEERALIGDGRIVERLLGLEFEASVNAFLQTNSRGAELLYGAALDAAEIGNGDTVLDLYSGTGTITLLAAQGAQEAIGVESVPAAVESARRNAKSNGIGNARFVEGESRAVLREWARGERPGRPAAGVVIVDPPRAGLHPRVVTRVVELAPRRVVYVSCNPATLARDLKDFAAGGYPLADVRPFDMFPHTPHIECVARMERG